MGYSSLPGLFVCLSCILHGVYMHVWPQLLYFVYVCVSVTSENILLNKS